MKISYSFPSILLLCLCLSVNGCSGEKYELSLKLQNAQTYGLHLEMSQLSEQTIQKQHQEVKQKIRINYSFVSDSDGDQTTNLTARKKTLYVNTDHPVAGAHIFDSENVEEPDSGGPVLNIQASILDKDLKLKLGIQGEVLELTGAQAAIEAYMKDMEIQLPPVLAQGAIGQFGDDAQREEFNQLLMIYPPEAVGLNESWIIKSSNKHVLPLISTLTFTLLAYDPAGEAKFSMKGELKSVLGETANIGGYMGQLQASGTTEGEYIVDVATGWIKEANLAMFLNGSINIGNQNVPLQLNRELTLTGTMP